MDHLVSGSVTAVWLSEGKYAAFRADVLAPIKWSLPSLSPGPDVMPQTDERFCHHKGTSLRIKLRVMDCTKESRYFGSLEVTAPLWGSFNHMMVAEAGLEEGTQEERRCF